MEYGTEISIASHRELMGLMEFVRNHSFPGFQDISIAYNSITIFYDPVIVYQNFRQSPISFVEQWLHSKATTFKFDSILPSGREHIIPVCYEPPFSPDLEAVAAFHNVSPEEIVFAHQSTSYYVFMVGFSPGFPYLGLVPPFLETPRKASPSLRVPAGSVGIAGRQTGIYPFTSPGGWNILGRTPLRVFNINDPDLCLLKAGDTVIFSPIDAKTFYYLNQYADS